MQSGAQADTTSRAPSQCAEPVLQIGPMERQAHEQHAVPSFELEEELPSNHEDNPAPVPHSTASAVAAPSWLMEEEASSSDEDINSEETETRVQHSTSTTTTGPVGLMEEQHSTESEQRPHHG